MALINLRLLVYLHHVHGLAVVSDLVGTLFVLVQSTQFGYPKQKQAEQSG